ncbi:MAG: amidohydrolase [Sphaerochaetaceae bacterium]|nr:amidohydrolase [Sphaerochaetaceae bacterium]
MSFLLIKNTTVLKPDMAIQDGTDVLIKDNIIDKIGKNLQIDFSLIDKLETLDGSGKLLMPGLVDGHTHCCQQLLRGKIADEYPMIWTRFLVPFESNLTEEDSYVSAQLACLEMIKFGTTTFADAGGVHMNRVCDAVLESGMRAAIAKSTMDMGNVVTGAMKETKNEAINNTIELYKCYNGEGQGRLRIFFGIRQVMTCSKDLIREVGEWSRTLNTGIHSHLCEHKDEVSFCLSNYGMRPVELLDSLGALGPNFLGAHSVYLTSHDFTILKEKDAKIIHCPRVNLTNHGFSRTPEILERGISVGLGSDGAAPNNLDLFEEMKILRHSQQCAWGLTAFDPKVMTYDRLLKMATEGGAKALGLEKEIGTIEVGKKADLILVDIQQPHLMPSHNIVSTIVDGASGRDVNDVIIDGKIVMKNREVLTLDEKEVIAKAQEHMKAIESRIRG